ncbi:MAG TPA: tRNA (adenosine(37)-N6)-dimethylallyltransferase MiaA [Actinomycetota bacterium]|nr:tRNA (adenosine(37)-N6)-dimethylallyltransferase MiaA [Actinomycetota bacterium]
MKTVVVALVGPTGVGKTSAAMDLAKDLNAEIVSIDSMQLYRGMDIGTDKATPEMRKQVRHHLLDVKEPTEEVTVAEFQALARDAITDIAGRGRTPLLVGGSGLYFRAVVDNLSFPPRAPEVRARLEEESEALGAEALHARLAEFDAKAAARIEPANARRTIRALEVIEITGRPFSDNDSWDGYESIYELRAIGLERPREELFERIERRVDEMLARGLVEETSRVAEAGMGRTARMALGYRQVLENPTATTQELKAEIVQATKRFARRQGSWFRADPRIEWVGADASDLANRVGLDRTDVAEGARRLES